MRRAITGTFLAMLLAGTVAAMAQTGTISGFVWTDTDGNGLQDVGELGIDNVQVNLLDNTGTVLFTVTTSGGGFYAFPSLVPAPLGYEIEVVPPLGEVFTLRDVGADDTIDSDVDPVSGRTGLFPLNAGDALVFDAGILGRADVVGTVWTDADGNGLQDAGELGIDNVQVNLLDNTGTVLFTVTTSAGGFYAFQNLLANTVTGYEIEVQPPLGEVFTLQDVGADDTIDSDVDPVTGRTGLFQLFAGTVEDRDAGIVGRADIVGTVWTDTDGNGLQDAGELGIDNVQVNLLDNTGTVLFTVTTSGGGFYAFQNLLANTVTGYEIEVQPPLGEVFTLQDVGADDTIDSDVDPITGRTGLFQLFAGTVEDRDAGILGRGDIVGTVWLDTDGDGIQDAGEAGIDNVQVNLLDNTGTVLFSVTTSGGGFYAFQDLLANTTTGYEIEVQPPLGEVFTLQDQGADDTVDSDVDPLTGRTGLFQLFAGTVEDRDAGILGRGTIVGFVWLDDDGDGIQDVPPESGVDKVEVRLLDDVGTLVDTSLTVFGGFYDFQNVPPGPYRIEFVLPSGRVFTLQDQGGDDGVDSDPDPFTGQTLLFALSAGETLAFDAGLRIATWAQITALRAVTDRGQIVVEWETRAEAGTIGFQLYREELTTGEWSPVREELIPALLGAPQGGRYRVVDESVPLSGMASYWLEELAADGTVTVHGPYVVEVGRERAAEPMDTLIERRAWEARAGYARALHRRSIHRRAARPRPPGPPAEAVKIVVRERGLFYVGTEDIAVAWGLPVSAIRQRIRLGNLSLTHLGRTVAWLPAADGLYFFAGGIDTIFTDEDAFWLRSGKGLTMEVVDGAAAGTHDEASSFAAEIHREEDLFALTALPLDAESDYWFWESLIAGHPSRGRRSYSLRVDEVSSESVEEARLTVHVQGLLQNPAPLSNRMVVSLNGVELGETRWNALEAHSASFPFDPSLLVSGDNTVTLLAAAPGPGGRGGFAVDSFDLVYPRSYRAVGPAFEFQGSAETVTIQGLATSEILVLDVSDPDRPELVTGAKTVPDGSAYSVSLRTVPDARYLITTGAGILSPDALIPRASQRLRSRGHGADYLVIAPRELEDAAGELVELRDRHGLRSTFVALEDIVDEFAHGVYSPYALRDFLAFAYETWRLAPRYVALVGSGTFDYKNRLGFGDNLLPAYMVTTPSGLHPSDSWFADVEGGDGLPEIAIGRIPILDAEELLAYVDKVAAYESGGGTGVRSVMVADNPDLGGDFPTDSEELVASLPGSEPVQRIYLSETPLEAARQQLFDALADDTDYVNYLGHGGVTVLAAEVLLAVEDLGSIPSSSRQPVFTALTCLVNYFASPGLESLGEAMARTPRGGAVAVWAPSWLSANTQSKALGQAFLQDHAAAPTGRLGDHILHALEDLAEQGMTSTVTSGFVLLGDPALASPHR